MLILSLGRFKSLDIANTNTSTASTEVDSSEFDAQRKANINQALKATTGTTKGGKMYGGIKQSETDDPLERAQFLAKSQRKSKKPATRDDKDPNVSDDEDGGRRGRRHRYLFIYSDIILAFSRIFSLILLCTFSLQLCDFYMIVFLC